MKTVKDITNELDEMIFRLECGISMVKAIQMAGELETDKAGGIYHEALFGACGYLEGIKDEIKQAAEQLITAK